MTKMTKIMETLRYVIFMKLTEYQNFNPPSSDNVTKQK